MAYFQENSYAILGTNQKYPGSCAIQGSGLYHAAADSKKNLFITRLDLLMSTEQWHPSEALSPAQIQFTNQVKPQTDLRPTLLVNQHQENLNVTSKLYLLWADSGHSHNCYASWAVPSPEGFMPIWSQGIRLYKDANYKKSGAKDQDSRLVVSKGSLSAVSIAGKLLITHLDPTNNLQFCVRLFDPTQITSDTSEFFWVQEESTAFTFNDLHNRNSDISQDKGTIASDIASTLLTFSPKNQWLMIGLFNHDDNEITLAALPIDSGTGLPSLTNAHVSVIQEVYGGVSLTTDPAGRIRIYATDKDGKPQACTLSTNQLSQMKLSSMQVLAPYAALKTTGVPSVVFSLAEAQTNPQTKTMHMMELGLLPDASNSDSTLGIGQYGSAKIQYRQQNLKQTSASQAPSWLCEGLMDAFPLMTTDVQAIEPGSAVFATTYGATSEVAKSHTVKTSTGIGVSSEGKVEVFVSASYKLSTDAGLDSELKYETRDTLADTKEVYSCTDENRNALAEMAIFAASMDLTADLFTFADHAGQAITDGCIQMVVYPIPAHRRTTSVGAYTVSSPGILTGWTEGAINGRMSSLFPVSSPYRKKYPFNNYVKDVIEAQALPIGENGEKYIEIAVGGSSFWGEGVQITQTEFVETSWNIGAEVGAGVSAGYTFEPAGIDIGIEISTSLKFATVNTDNTEKKSEWGITVNPQPCSERFSPQTSYSVRLYLLKASTQWVEELQAVYSSDDFVAQLSPYAAPWRIAYVVRDDK